MTATYLPGGWNPALEKAGTAGQAHLTLQIGFFPTTDPTSTNASRDLAVPQDTPVGSYINFGGPPPHIEGAGSTQQQLWAQQAVLRNTAFGTAGDAFDSPISPTSQTPNTVPPTYDRWQWDAIGRRQDWLGTQMIRFVDDFISPTPYEGTVQQRGPYDVVFSWHADPSSKMDGEAAYTEWNSATGTYEVRLASWLGTVFAQPPMNSARFYKESCWHELGHVAVGLAMENYGADRVIAELTAIFGGTWNTGPWRGRTLEAACETFKDWMYPERVFNNRTRLQLPEDKYLDFANLIVQGVWSAGPLLRTQVVAEDDFGEGKIDLHSGPNDIYPQFSPRWDYNRKYKVPYDFPEHIDSPYGPSFARLRGSMWKWGGRGTAPGGGNAALRSNPGDYREPPAPGSKVEFVVGWDDPLGEFPPGWPDYAATKELVKPLLPPGVMSIDVGGPAAQFLSAPTTFGNENATLVQGIWWFTGTSGQANWDHFKVIPAELRRISWQEYYAFTTDLIPRYEPVYFDMRTKNEIVLELTVPDHGGELGFGMSFFPTGENGSGSQGLGSSPFAVRTYHNGRLWSTFPDPGPLIPYTYVQGNIQTRKVAPAFSPTPQYVMGTRMLSITLDP